MIRALIFLIAVLLTSGAAAAQDADLSPSPDELLRSMVTLLKSADAFTVHSEKTFDDVLEDGTKVQYAGASDLAMLRPDGLHINYGDDISAKEFWYDGRTFTLMDHLHNVYVTAPAAPTLPEAISQLQSEYGIFLPLASLLRADPSGAYGEGVESRLYLGIHDVDGVRSHHVLFRGEKIDWQLWIEDGDLPLLRKVVVTYKTLPGSPQDIVVLTDWELHPELDHEDFAADVPDHAIRAAFLGAEEQGQ